MTWSEDRSLIHLMLLVHLLLSLVMGSLHRLEAVASAEEALDLRVVVIVVHGLNELGMPELVFLIVELVRKTRANVAVKLGLRTVGGFLNRLASFKVQLHVFFIDAMARIRVARHVARLVGH